MKSIFFYLVFGVVIMYIHHGGRLTLFQAIVLILIYSIADSMITIARRK